MSANSSAVDNNTDAFMMMNSLDQSSMPQPPRTSGQNTERAQPVHVIKTLRQNSLVHQRTRNQKFVSSSVMVSPAKKRNRTKE